MKSILITIVFIFNLTYCFSQPIALPLLHYNVPVNDTLRVQPVSFSQYCYSINQNFNNIQIDSFAFAPVNGVRIYYIVQSVPTGIDSAYTLQTGRLHIGDTLKFDSALSTYTLYSTGVGLVYLRLMISGTPLAPGEYYPCSLQVYVTTALCANTITTGLYNYDSCQVDNFSEISADYFNKKPIVSINQETKTVSILNEIYVNANVQFRIYDVSGKRIFDQKLREGVNTFSINDLKGGIYFWQLLENGISQSGKIFLK